jgi:hypothetical protein
MGSGVDMRVEIAFGRAADLFIQGGRGAAEPTPSWAGASRLALPIETT